MKVSPYLRRTEVGYTHWCPGCEQMHPLPDSWTFNGDVNKPTFTPSFKQSGYKRIMTEDGHWTGQWGWSDELDGPVPFICHYILTAGILNFCADCSHKLAGQKVPLPELPEGYNE